MCMRVCWGRLAEMLCDALQRDLLLWSGAIIASCIMTEIEGMMMLTFLLTGCMTTSMHCDRGQGKEEATIGPKPL